MPYIKSNMRAIVDYEIEQLIEAAHKANDNQEGLDHNPPIEGIANYVVTRIISGIFNDGGWRYHSLAHAVGCLESVKAELQRRVIAEYEQKAIEKIGDIPEYQSPFDRDMNDRRYS